MINTIIFLVSSLSQPRAIRRVESIAALGYDVKVYGYDRGQYNCNKFSAGINVNVLGKLRKGGGYLGKIKQIGKDIKAIVEEHNGKATLFYSFGFIETFFLYKSNEIMIRQAEFTLLTSEGFRYFLDVDDARIIIQPNKVNRKLLGCQRNVLQKLDNSFIFSFVGSIRYEPILRFAKVIGENFPQHEFHFYGVANVEYTKNVLEDLVTRYKNVKAFGEFKNPDDFEKIYNKIDVVVTTYGLTFNESILEPNKLYEGILFCRPLIGTKGSFLAKQIDRYQCGWNIDSSSDEGIIKFVSGLTADQANDVSAKERRIQDSFAFDNMDNLKQMLASL